MSSEPGYIFNLTADIISVMQDICIAFVASNIQCFVVLLSRYRPIKTSYSQFYHAFSENIQSYIILLYELPFVHNLLNFSTWSFYVVS